MPGKILKVKHGYNPNSSSMGSIIFALPVSLIAVSFGMAAVSGLIMSHFVKDADKARSREQTRQNDIEAQ
jgi:hypothetical protein